MFHLGLLLLMATTQPSWTSDSATCARAATTQVAFTQEPQHKSAPQKNVAQSKSPKTKKDGKGEPSGNPVPEPATLLLVGSGLVGLALSRRLRRSSHAS